ncbi:MAG: glycosyltransferase [Planctomycetota bacterium]
MTPSASIALDYTSGPGHAPGVGRYIRELVRALIRLEDGAPPPLELLEFGRAPTPMEGPPLGLTGDDIAADARFLRRRSRLPRRLVAQLGRAPRIARAVLGPSASAALLHRTIPAWPPVGEIRDSIAVAELPARGTAAHARLGEACRRAAGVLVFSDEGAARVEDELGVRGSSIYRSPVGSEHWERDLRTSSLQGPLVYEPRLTRDILVLGAIRESRMPRRALEAFQVLIARGVQARIVFVGRRGDDAGEFIRDWNRFRVAQGSMRAADAACHWMHSPEEAQLPICVAGSTVLLHLSEDELSPVTPLEAARMGLALVTSPLPAFQEALGNAARYVDAADPAAVADALEAALEDGSNPDARRSQHLLAQPYTWDAAARAHRDAWNRMLGGA